MSAASDADRKKAIEAAEQIIGNAWRGRNRWAESLRAAAIAIVEEGWRPPVSATPEQEALREQVEGALRPFHEPGAVFERAVDAVLAVLPSRESDGICDVCGGPGEFYDSPTGSWWSHLRHPSDEHDFEPKVRETVAPMFSNDTFIDLYWRTTGDDWAIPEEVMVKYGRAVLALLSGEPYEAGENP